MIIAPIPCESAEFWKKLIELLAGCQLPVADIGCGPTMHFFGVVDNAEPLATVGLEIAGCYGLLRSLAVRAEVRGHGLGRQLVAHVEQEARSRKLEALYLLTTDARDYFARLGYAPVDRAEVPDPIRQTTQFSSLCPSTAHLLGKRLRRHEEPR